MANVLTNPDQFFSELSAKDVKLRTPFTIVLVVAIISAVSNVLMNSVMASSFTGGMEAYEYLPAITSGISGFIMPFGAWLLCSDVFYVISSLFGGSGSSVRVFEFVGYGFAPHIVGSVVKLVVIMVGSPNELYSEGFQQTDPLILIYSIIPLLLVVYGVIIWISAVKHARNIGTKQSIITVLLIPVILCLIWCIFVLCRAYVGVL